MITTYREALDSALRILSRRDHSVAELKRKLNQRHVDQAVIDQVVSECLRLNYLNDVRFAQGLIRVVKRKGRGPLHLTKAFHRLGLKGPETRRLLSEAYSEGEQLTIARRVAEKKCESIVDPEPRKRREKLYRFLSSRGFSKSVILETLRDVVQPPDN